MHAVQLALAATAGTSFAIAAFLVVTSGAHGRFTMDTPGAVQTFHTCPTPRVGGIGIYLALLLATGLMPGGAVRDILATIVIAGLPALLIGLLEDVTHRAGIRARLVATVASGLAASALSGVALDHVAVPVLDSFLMAAPVALAFTALAVGGVANAVNIIDGFHGLASGTATLCVAALGAIAVMVGDTALAFACAVVGAAVAGFWLVNFPWGKLFLGDGGAYFAGFALAWLAVLLPMRNPDVSSWASLLVCGYPITEALYSILRRRFARRSPTQADRRHLHSLIATRVVVPRLRGIDPTLQNAAVSVVMWICAAIPALVGVTFYSDTSSLAIGAAACVLLYHCLYRRVASA
jgi:UDP-N-acetylmuramyl pentapeptide phosphotransferase/UDP-N-acetylglucosamine-1-phosphate transferase